MTLATGLPSPEGQAGTSRCPGASLDLSSPPLRGLLTGPASPHGLTRTRPRSPGAGAGASAPPRSAPARPARGRPRFFSTPPPLPPFLAAAVLRDAPGPAAAAQVPGRGNRNGAGTGAAPGAAPGSAPRREGGKKRGKKGGRPHPGCPPVSPDRPAERGLRCTGSNLRGRGESGRWHCGRTRLLFPNAARNQSS